MWKRYAVYVITKGAKEVIDIRKQIYRTEKIGVNAIKRMCKIVLLKNKITPTLPLVSCSQAGNPGNDYPVFLSSLALRPVSAPLLQIATHLVV